MNDNLLTLDHENFELWELILSKIGDGDFNENDYDFPDKEDDVDPKQC
jgi:hypothetical protein